MIDASDWALVTVDWLAVDAWGGLLLGAVCAVWALQKAIRLIGRG